MILLQLFVNNYELFEIEKLTAIKYWSRMNELTCFKWKYSKKLESYQKMINMLQEKQGFVFLLKLYLFYEIKT